MARLSLLIFCLVSLASRLAGQQFPDDNFDHYTIESGLSNNAVTGIAQDARGYIWIGTVSGLNRFNGSRFVQFHSSDDSLSLPSEVIGNMAWIDRHRLAVMTVGLHIIDTKSGITRNLFIPYHDQRYQFKFNMIERIRGDEKGHLYIVARSGFYHYDENYQLVSRFDYYNEAEVPAEHFFWGKELFELDEKRFLIYATDGLYIYDKRERKLRKMSASDCPMIAEVVHDSHKFYSFWQVKRGIFLLHKPADGNLIYVNTIENKKTVSKMPFQPSATEFHWRSRLIAANDTLFYLTSHLSGFFKLRLNVSSGNIQLDPQRYFGSYLCSSLLCDSEKNLWVTTTNGLFRHNPQRSRLQQANLPSRIEVEFPDTRVDDIYVSADKVYAGIRGGGGLMVFDKKTLKPSTQVLFKKNITTHFLDAANSVRAITAVDRNTLLLGTSGPLLFFNRKSETLKEFIPPKWYYPGDWTNDIYKDSKGNIWISANYIYKYNPASGHVKVFSHNPRLPSVPVAIEEDTAGNIWMAGHGLTRYNTRRDSFDFVLDSFPYIKMPDQQINAMLIDRRNRIWFNSANNGIAVYDIATRKFLHLTRNNGLPDNNISSQIIIGDKLWLASYSGLACINLETLQIVSFGKDDGFPEMPVIRGARFFYDSPMQQLYIGFSTAFVRFNPNEMLRRKLPPQVFIENLIVNGKTNHFLPGDRITASWKDSELRVTIGTINFSDGPSQRFAYRILKKGNNQWMHIGSQPSFNISNLSPGTHRVQVKAFSPSNRWPEQVHEMAITILPPLWQKPWFVIAMLALAAMIVYSLIKWRIGQVRRKEMEKTHLQKLKAEHYKSQFELEQISNYFSSSLTSKKTEEDVLWDVAQNLIGRMNYEDCIIYLWNADRTKMIQKAAYGPKGKPEHISSQVFDVLPGQGIVGHVIQTQQPILVNDTRLDKRYRVDDDFRLSEVCVPIIHNGELLGIIDSENREAGYYSERDIKILTTIATLIGNKLKQIESEQSLDAKRKELVNINEQLAEARLSALQSQMNPHFVFNALNSIKWMILDGDNEKASRYLSKFALMIRMTLDHSKEVFVTLDENIQYLQSYLEMEQLRFDDSFTYSIHVDENIEAAETTIPSMMIQPLVENAIWHGLMHAEADKKIRISFTQDDNTITCTVEDNGIGIRKSEKLKEKARAHHHSVGLENLKKRVNIMNEKYDMNCSLVITDLKDISKNQSGTRVVLQFNMINV